MTEALIILVAPLAIGSLIVAFASAGTRMLALRRLRGRRYNGRPFDPTRPIRQRAGAARVGLTGRMCPRCGIATYGWSERCGKCHLPPTPSLVPSDTTRDDAPATAVP